MNFSNTTEIKNIGILVYGRFPTEKAYGTHIVEVAKAFLSNQKKVTIFYSKTSNKYTINEDPQTFYDIPQNIEVKALDNFDYTNFRLFSLLPSILKKFGIIKYSLRPVKILAHGELSKKVNIVASAFSKSAIEKIEKNGGKAIQN